MKGEVMASEFESRGYLSLLKPTPEFFWASFYAIYTDALAFNSLLDDLAEPFSSDEIDLVAGPEAMGFHLGGGLAARMRKGFLPIRRPGKLTGPTDRVEYPYFKGGTKSLELQSSSVKPGSRVLLVDQWIETGASIRAAIELIERQQASVVGIAAVCIEEGKGADDLRGKYKCATAVLPGTPLQAQCNSHTLELASKRTG